MSTTLLTKYIKTSRFAFPVLATYLLVAAILNRFYSWLGFELILAIAGFVGMLVNYFLTTILWYIKWKRDERFKKANEFPKFDRKKILG